MNMKAIVLKTPGGAENLILTEIPSPVPGKNEVLVAVKAIGINPIDVKTRSGKGLYGTLKDADPLILGWDISGTVTESGSGTAIFKPGDEVFGMINFPGHGKAYAEYVAAPADHLALKPANISHGEAAGASLAALTAWQLLKYRSGIKKGDRVLIHSAAGGVGHFAVQMAKHLGAWVAGTSSAGNRQLVLDLGADKHIDYQNQRFEDELQNLDFVLDTIGNDYTERSFSVLKPGGSIICIPSGTSPDITEKAAARKLSGSHFRVWSDRDDMTDIANMLQKGIIRTHISKKFTFDEIMAAHNQIETGRTRGKVVVIL
jgi:NADPH:quinone reductase-like Zn-dependent oxidoreductase